MVPGLWVFWLALNDKLGADPVKALEHTLGLWALRFLIASLAVTPLRRFGGPKLVKFRRALGLLAFFYACAHLAAYLLFDQGLDAGAIIRDIAKRPYLTIGMFALAILTPLAVTSNDAIIKRIGAAAWQKLHRWVYVAAIAAAVHFIMVVKSWPVEPLVYAAIVAALLLTRVGFALRKRAKHVAAI
jgi:sulfoxide reductase heme-binding subunit YedZ